MARIPDCTGSGSSAGWMRGWIPPPSAPEALDSCPTPTFHRPAPTARESPQPAPRSKLSRRIDPALKVRCQRAPSYHRPSWVVGEADSAVHRPVRHSFKFVPLRRMLLPAAWTLTGSYTKTPARYGPESAGPVGSAGGSTRIAPG